MSSIDEAREAPPRPPESTPPSRVKPIRKKTIIETRIVRRSGTGLEPSSMLQLQQKRPLCKQLYRTSKKLVLVLATFAPVTKASQKDIVVLDRIPCICYPIWFKKSKVQVQALFDSGSKINAITLEYALKLGLKIRPTDVGAQKINSSTFKTFGMVLASFQVEDTLGRAWFFWETFLLADLSVKVVLGMPFLTLSNADIKFA